MTASSRQSLPCAQFTAEKHHIGYSHLNTGVSREQIQMVYTPNFDKQWNQPKTDSVSGALNAEPDTYNTTGTEASNAEGNKTGMC